MNDDKNLLGRVIALALILGAAYGASAIAHGGFSCPFGEAGRCVMSIPAAAPAPAVDTKEAPVEAAPVEKDSEDEDATLEKKAPVVPPAPAEKTK